MGALASGGTINSNDEADLLQTLNVIAKEYQGASDMAPGMKVWTRQRITLALAKGQQTYSIGPASTDSRASTQMGRTTISADEALGQTVLSITSNTDTTTYPGTTLTMTASDFIGIELNDGTIQWTTISGTPASTATVAVALTAAASAGNYVYWFTARAQRFPTCEAAVLRAESYTTTPLDVYADLKQYELGVADKYADAQPAAILIEPLRITTRVTLNAQPTNVAEQIILTALYPAEDYDATTDDIAFPQEWYGLLEWELTMRGCPMFGKKFTPEMKLCYDLAKSRAVSLNPENSVLFFQCNG